MRQTSNSAVLLIFPDLFISGIHEVPSLKFKGGYVMCPGPAKSLNYVTSFTPCHFHFGLSKVQH